MTIPSVSTNEGIAWLEGPLPDRDGAVRQAFSAEIGELPRLYGLWRPKWEENGTDFSIEVTDFGWEDKAALDALEQPKQRRLWLKQAAAVRRLVGRLFQECAETGALTLPGHPDARYVGNVQFIQGWVGLLSRPLKPRTTITTEAGNAQIEGSVRCWDEEGRNCFSAELVGQPRAFGAWEAAWENGGPRFDILVKEFGWRDKSGIGCPTPSRIRYSQAQQDALHALVLQLFRVEGEERTVFPISGEYDTFSGNIMIQGDWLLSLRNS